MREEASKLLYETPTIGILSFHNEGPICQSGNVEIDSDFDDEIEVPLNLFSQPSPGTIW